MKMKNEIQTRDKCNPLKGAILLDPPLFVQFLMFILGSVSKAKGNKTKDMNC